MNRREFFVGWTALQRGAVGLKIEVIEVFASPDGLSACLVHHAEEATRNTFSGWLRANDAKQVAFRHRDGTRIEARVFRVRFCFGRGLILTSSQLAIGEKDIFTVL